MTIFRFIIFVYGVEVDYFRMHHIVTNHLISKEFNKYIKTQRKKTFS